MLGQRDSLTMTGEKEACGDRSGWCGRTEDVVGKHSEFSLDCLCLVFSEVANQITGWRKEAPHVKISHLAEWENGKTRETEQPVWLCRGPT